MQKLLNSRVVSNFEADVDIFEKIVPSVLSQAGYAKLIPDELKSRLTSAYKEMRWSMGQIGRAHV